MDFGVEKDSGFGWAFSVALLAKFAFAAVILGFGVG